MGCRADDNNICCLVNHKDRPSPQQVIEYLKKLRITANTVKDPEDDIKVIFDKILAWKKKFGDLDQQEKAVSKALRNSKKNSVKVHNVKTLTEKL